MARELLFKIIEIIEWNMEDYQSPNTNPVHGLEFGLIRSVAVTIVNDDGTRIYNLLSADVTEPSIDGNYYVDATVVCLSRKPGGFFEQATFSAVSDNRGWIVIGYQNPDPNPPSPPQNPRIN